MSSRPDSFRVIVAEDDPVLRETLKIALERSGLACDTVSDGVQALDLFSRSPSDAVLLDAIMPNQDGIITCKLLRHLPGGEHIPIIILTGIEQNTIIHQAFEAGATDFLRKPVALAGLAQRLRRLIIAGRNSDTLRQAQAIVAGMTDMAFWLNDDSLITFANRAALLRIAHEEADLTGQCLWDLLKPASAETIRGSLRHIPLDAANQFEMPMTDPHGKSFLCQIIVTAQRINNQRCYCVLLRDITVQKQAEEDRLRNDRLRTLGVIAGGVAHDFNNILTAINNAHEIVLLELPPVAPAALVIRETRPALEQAKGLARQLLTFAKGGAPVKRALDLAQLVRDTASFSLRGTRTTPEFFFAENLWPAEVDPGQVGQVITNLVLNASQAMNGEGKIHIHLSNKTIAAPPTTNLSPGNYLELIIQDFGPGISQETLEHVFDPYFTTKSSGSGLGLTTALSIVRRHSGDIRIESALGSGTKVICYLPGNEHARITPDTPPPFPSKSRKRILILEDQDIIARSLTLLLDRLGYRPHVTIDGTDTINAFADAKAEDDPFDALILDLTVPSGVGGLEVLRRLHSQGEKLRAIVSSGYSDDPALANPADYGFMAVLPKPFSLDQLAHALTTVLEKDPV